ncbi:MFS transporter [Butyricimonas synergistica]|uniref:MFS transporter n=1 Tax=Butyricimonas synergistica TaxID=544644 RepID=UPI00037B770C|nr:MFS transporter [Butyricimonas synergistica]
MNNWKKVFAIIWTGQFFSILTSSLVNFAIILWLTFETKSAETLAFATIAALLPQAILGLFSGILIDRWSRKLIMILSDSFIAFCTLILAILFYFEQAEIWQIYTLLALRSVGSAFHMPSMQASIPLLAPEPQLLRIAGINQMIQSVSNIAGPALGALAISMLDMTYVLMLDVVGALLACTSLLFVTIPNPKPSETKNKLNLLRDLREAQREVTSHKGMTPLFLLSILATLFIMPISVLFPLMTLNHFSGSAYQMSLVEAIWSVGSLAGGLALSARQYKVNKIILINAMYILLGTAFVFSGLLPASAFVWFVVLTAIEGVSGSVYYASFMTVIQTKINPAVLGRVFSIFMSVSMLPSILGLMGTGFIADNIGITNTFVIGGLVVCAIGAISFFIPSLFQVGRLTVGDETKNI